MPLRFEELTANPLPGEKAMAWFIVRGSIQLMLPDWLRRIIDDLILWWTKEKKKWAKTLKDRREKGFNALPPKAAQAYAQFLKLCDADLVLDKTRKVRVMQPQKCKPSYLLKCTLVTVHLDEQPEKLTLTTAKGDSYRLSLQLSDGCHANTSDEIPNAWSLHYFICLLQLHACTLRHHTCQTEIM